MFGDGTYGKSSGVFLNWKSKKIIGLMLVFSLILTTSFELKQLILIFRGPTK